MRHVVLAKLVPLYACRAILQKTYSAGMDIDAAIDDVAEHIRQDQVKSGCCSLLYFNLGTCLSLEVLLVFKAHAAGGNLMKRASSATHDRYYC